MQGVFDIGANYESPIYVNELFYTWRARVAAYLGGRSSVSFTVTPLRFNFYIDFYPVRYTLENYLSFDMLGTLGNRDWCMRGSGVGDLFRIPVYLQIDYQECELGLLGVLTTDFSTIDPASTEYECEWYNNYVSQPLFGSRIGTQSKEVELYRSRGCRDREIVRYDHNHSWD